MRAPEFWYAKRPRLLGSLASAALSPLGALYDFVGAIKERLSDPFDCGVPIICIGNLTVGGTGKTPLAMALACALKAWRPAFLTRGYGGRLAGPVRVDPGMHTASDVGDEPLLLAGIVPTFVARQRIDGAHAAREAGAGLILMDDGFQNFALKKNIALAVIDGQVGFGNGRVVPAGPLREKPSRGLARADAVVLMGPTDKHPAYLHGFERPIFHAVLEADPNALPSRPLIAFAGIGRPEKFFASLSAVGRAPAETHAFADHHTYTSGEIETLLQRARTAGAQLVTTQKDHVRLPPALAAQIAWLSVHAKLAEEAEFLDFLKARLPAPPRTD